MPPKNNQHGPEHAQTPMGQYYLLDKIAQGGMAEIYKGLAYDLHGIKKTVVIKKILPEIAANPEFINMLINEAKIAVMLSHGNIAQIYDLGKVGNDYFMVMEYVDGKSLSQIHKRNLKNGSLIPVEYVCYFISEVASGLDYMHRRSNAQGRNLGIIHRDISPQNLIVSYSGTLKIIDFGIAKAAIQMHITDSGILKGKFAYMSPEQAKGEPVDNRSDIFSLGVILHELLTGLRLFKGKDKRETLKNVRRADAPLPSSLRADIPPEIDQIVMKALTKDPKSRYMWASELRDNLIKFLYTYYPDFQPSSVTGYIREIFKDEFAEKEDMEEEAKTPFLIIDHTQSAIMPEKLEATNITRVPPQLSEFMLDEETPLPRAMPEELLEKLEQENLMQKILRTIKASARTLAIALGGIAFVLVGAYLLAPSFLAWLKPKTRLVLYVDPPDAEITFGEEIIKGKPPFKLKNIKPGTDYRLIVEKDGYVPYFYTVSLKEGEKQRLDIRLVPEPPHYAELTIASEPPGATIFLNEKETTLKTPATLPPLEPNKYITIGLFMDGYAFWSRDIILKPDEKNTFHTKLEVSYGELQIISTPEGAEVYIDGVASGKTPFTQKNLPPGKVMDITVGKDGFTSWSEKVQIKSGSPLVLHPKLSRTKELLVPHFLRNLDKPAGEAPEEAPSNEVLPAAPAN